MSIDLDRFIHAQDSGAYAQAIAELQAGAKRSHWIWFIFPQLAGLGSSPMAETYGLHGIEEASAYLRHVGDRNMARRLPTAGAADAAPRPLRALPGRFAPPARSPEHALALRRLENPLPPVTFSWGRRQTLWPAAPGGPAVKIWPHRWQRSFCRR